MLDLEQQLARVGVDELDEAVLVLAVFLADQPALRQPRMDAAEIDEGQLDVVAVIGRQGRSVSRKVRYWPGATSTLATPSSRLAGAWTICW